MSATQLNFRNSKHHPSNRNTVKLRNYLTGQEHVDTLCANAREETPCQPKSCGASLMFPFCPEQLERSRYQPRSAQVLLRDAKEFIEGYYRSMNRPCGDQEQTRWRQIQEEVGTSGTYSLTTQELTYGAKLAWRNASRCIGRIQWNKLTVQPHNNHYPASLFDARDVGTPEQMFDAICNHIRYSNNKGNLRSAITVFPQRTDGRHDYRVWNKQLIAYAGYPNKDGSVTGDPATVEFTEVCMHLGWAGPGTRFDILPIVVSADGQCPVYFDVPPEIVVQVEISHPKYDWLQDLDLKWHALPAVSGMLFDCGGLEFPAAPFSGWYMSTEIASRNLCDPNRYNMLEVVAKQMGLDTSTPRTLWKDRALVEMNVAVLHSFQLANVTMVDHHTASESFIRFMQTEQRVRGGCPSDWVWIVPPISGSATPVFHQEMCKYVLKPTYTDQVAAWTMFDWKRLQTNGAADKQQKKRHFRDIAGLVQFTSHLYGEAVSRRIKATILYASETGKSEGFAKLLEQVMSFAFNAKAVCMDDYDIFGLQHECLLFIVASTFGNGDAPDNGESFLKHLENMDNQYSLLSSSSTMDSVHNDVSPSTQAKRAIPIAPFYRSFSTPKSMNTGFMNSGFVNSKGVSNMSEPSTPLESVRRLSGLGDSYCSEASNGVLANIRYAVFALGSSAYPNFCNYGKNVDTMLSELSADRLLPVTCGDELNAQELCFREWSLDVFKAACETFCLENDELISLAADRLNPDKAVNRDTIRLKPSATGDSYISGLQRTLGRDVSMFRVLHAEPLHSPRDGRLTMSLAMTTLEPSAELQFQPGDHLAVFPRNRRQTVDDLLSRVEASSDEPLELQVQRQVSTARGIEKQWRAEARLPKASLRDLLTHYLDITSPPTTMLLHALASMATDTAERHKIKQLATNCDEYETWKHRGWWSVQETLDQFPSIRLNPALFVHKLPLLKPRLYSISSSLALYPEQVHLTVAVVQYTTQAGIDHYGVCSNFLKQLSPGDAVAGYFRSAASFHMPVQKGDSMLLVGPGTGVAPFRSFWQQRAYDRRHAEDKNLLGKMLLFFGCRHRDMDLYPEEKNNMFNDGVLAGNYLALSRDKFSSREYVQDQLVRQSDDVMEVLTSSTGHVYICGDCAMSVDVCNTLTKLLVNRGALTLQQAQSHVQQMEREGRFHEDIFGITLRTAEVTRKTRERLVSNSLE